MGRPPEPITSCPHTDRKHYARGFCRSCWDKDSRRLHRERDQRIARRLAEVERSAAA